MKMVHIRAVKVGDTVLHNGIARTVTAGNITYDDFMGKKIWGDSYALGLKKVILI